MSWTKGDERADFRLFSQTPVLPSEVGELRPIGVAII
jgi:hypothetical protein